MKYILCFLLVTTSVFAQDFVFDKEKGRAVPSYVGQLKLMKGKVFKKTGETVKDVETGERFKKDDVIITDAKSFAKILIVDDSIISIGPESEVRIDEFDFKDKTDRKMSLTLLKGQLTGNVKNKNANPGDIKFRSKYTTMGIRGTYILMNARTKNSLDIAEYALLSGKADVTDHKDIKFDMKKGDRIVIYRDNAKELNDMRSRQMTADEFKNLEATQTDEIKDFKPFLPFVDLKELEATTLQDSDVQMNEETAANKRTDKKPTWQQNLKKLNEKLKENQKKK
jgi:hypothetical protein